MAAAQSTLIYYCYYYLCPIDAHLRTRDCKHHPHCACQTFFFLSAFRLAASLGIRLRHAPRCFLEKVGLDCNSILTVLNRLCKTAVPPGHCHRAMHADLQTFVQKRVQRHVYTSVGRIPRHRWQALVDAGQKELPMRLSRD